MVINAQLQNLFRVALAFGYANNVLDIHIVQVEHQTS